MVLELLDLVIRSRKLCLKFLHFEFEASQMQVFLLQVGVPFAQKIVRLLQLLLQLGNCVIQYLDLIAITRL